LVPSHLFRLFLFPAQFSFQMMVPKIKAFWQEPNLKRSFNFKVALTNLIYIHFTSC
jgi:hypothetical protein